MPTVPALHAIRMLSLFWTLAGLSGTNLPKRLPGYLGKNVTYVERSRVEDTYSSKILVAYLLTIACNFQFMMIS